MRAGLVCFYCFIQCLAQSLIHSGHSINICWTKEWKQVIQVQIALTRVKTKGRLEDPCEEADISAEMWAMRRTEHLKSVSCRGKAYLTPYKGQVLVRSGTWKRPSWLQCSEEAVVQPEVRVGAGRAGHTGGARQVFLLTRGNRCLWNYREGQGLETQLAHDFKGSS